MTEQLAGAWRALPNYLAEHVLLSAFAMGLGLTASCALTIAALRSPRVRWPILTAASLIQTIPGLALLALFYPVLLALAALSEQVLGYRFSALGFLPSLLALTLYSMLPVIRNGVAAVLNLDPAVVEAARAVGMTKRQRFWRVELPLATPMLMAGVRTAAVWVIGAATLSTPVGQNSLGNYIFSGLQLQNWVSVLFGCVAAAALALLVDQILALIESGIVRRRSQRIAAGALLLAGGVAAAAAGGPSGAGAGYVIGAKSFSEQFILAELLARRIDTQGATAAQRTGLGSAIAFQALVNGDIDVYIDYTGTIWANVLGRSDAAPRDVVLAETGDWLSREHGIELLGPLGFENAYGLAMKRDRAEELGVASIDDLAPYAPRLAIGGDFEFFGRPEWTAIREAYGLDFARRREFESTFMYAALASGDVDVISAFTSDGRIAADDLVVLEDTRGAILPYDAIVLIAAENASDPRLRTALRPLIGAIPVALMREANFRVDRARDKETPAAAAAWLDAQLRGEGDR